MKENTCLFERFSKNVIGMIFLFIALGFVLSGFTVLPFFGFLLAIPVLLVSFYFFRAHLNEQCQIEET